MVASDHDLGSWILGQDQRDLALARVHAALEEHAEDGKVGFGLNDVRYLGGSELKHLENRNRNGVKGWFVSSGWLSGSCAMLIPCYYSRLVMRILRLGVGIASWRIEFGRSRDWSRCQNPLVRLVWPFCKVDALIVGTSQLPPLSRTSDPALTGVKTPRSNESTVPCHSTLPVKQCFDRSLFSRSTCETTNSYSRQWKHTTTPPMQPRSRNTSPGRKRRSTRSFGEVVRQVIRTASGKETPSMTGGTSIGLGWR